MEMKLMPQYFDFIKDGTKRIELRLNDEKRKTIKIGDTIIFLKEPNHEETIITKVVDLFNYSNFEDLIKDFDIEVLADKSVSKSELLEILNKIYPSEEQTKYGVLGIQVELL